MGIAIIVGVITNLGRGSWGVGHWGEGAKRKCMTGGVRLKDISISRFRCGGRGGCCGAAMQKTLDARACLPPRSASLCLFRSIPSSKKYLARLPGPGPPEFLRRSDEGSWGFTGPHPTLAASLCTPSPPVSSESPDTLRRRCQPTSPKATADKSDQTHPSSQPRSQRTKGILPF